MRTLPISAPPPPLHFVCGYGDDRVLVAVRESAGGGIKHGAMDEKIVVSRAPRSCPVQRCFGDWRGTPVSRTNHLELELICPQNGE